MISNAADPGAISGTIRTRGIDRPKQLLAVKLTEGSLKRIAREQTLALFRPEGPRHVRIVLSSPVSFRSFSRSLGSVCSRDLVHIRFRAWHVVRISSSGLRSKAGGRLRILVASISVVLPVFCNFGRIVRLGLDDPIPPPLVTLVHSLISIDFVHVVLPGSGQRRDQ